MKQQQNFPKSQFVLYTLVSERERYWTGARTETGLPGTTASYADARKFDTPEDAYRYATANLRRIPSLDWFTVGRRPLPLPLPMSRNRKFTMEEIRNELQAG